MAGARARDGKGVAVVPLTADRWDDVTDLFGPKGASSGCWCMWHRVSGRPEWTALGPEGRRAGFGQVVAGQGEPGLLALEDGKAIGWVAVAPRAEVPRFRSQKVSQPVDGQGGDDGATFVISCFYSRPGERKRGLMRLMARAAIDYAAGRGAHAVEACPIETDKPLMWGEGFVGIVSVFRDLGFTEIARRSPRRPLMRLELGR